MNNHKTSTKPSFESAGIYFKEPENFKTPLPKRRLESQSKTQPSGNSSMFPKQSNYFDQFKEIGENSILAGMGSFFSKPAEKTGQSMFAIKPVNPLTMAPQDGPLKRNNIFKRDENREKFRQTANDSPNTQPGYSPQAIFVKTNHRNATPQKIETSRGITQGTAQAFSGLMSHYSRSNQGSTQKESNQQSSAQSRVPANPFIRPHQSSNNSSANILQPKPVVETRGSSTNPGTSMFSHLIPPGNTQQQVLPYQQLQNQTVSRPSHLINFGRGQNSILNAPQPFSINPPQQQTSTRSFLSNQPLQKRVSRPPTKGNPRYQSQFQPIKLPQQYQDTTNFNQDMPQKEPSAQVTKPLPIQTGLPCEIEQLLLLDYHAHYFQPIEEPKIQLLHNLITVMTYREQKKEEQKKKKLLPEGEKKKEVGTISTEVSSFQSSASEQTILGRSRDDLDEDETVQQFINKMKSTFLRSYDQLSDLCDKTLLFMSNDIATARHINSKFDTLQTHLSGLKLNTDDLYEIQQKQDEIERILNQLDKKFTTSQDSEAELTHLCKIYEECYEIVKDASSSFELQRREGEDNKQLDCLNSIYVFLEDIESLIKDMDEEVDKIVEHNELENTAVRKRTKSEAGHERSQSKDHIKRIIKIG